MTLKLFIPAIITVLYLQPMFVFIGMVLEEIFLKPVLKTRQL